METIAANPLESVAKSLKIQNLLISSNNKKYCFFMKFKISFKIKQSKFFQLKIKTNSMKIYITEKILKFIKK